MVPRGPMQIITRTQPTPCEPTKVNSPPSYSGGDAVKIVGPRTTSSGVHDVLAVHRTARYLYFQQTTNRIPYRTVFLAEDQSLWVSFSFTYQWISLPHLV